MEGFAKPVGGSGVRNAGGLALTANASGNLPAGVDATTISVLTTDPVSPVVGQIWYRSDTSQLCVRHSSSTTKRVGLA